MKVRILTSALNDLRRGQSFYERQAEGLGDYFLDALFSDIDSLMLYAGMHRRQFGYHRLLSKRFPFAVYYQMQSRDEAVVLRVLDCRQDPARTRAALR